MLFVVKDGPKFRYIAEPVLVYKRITSISNWTVWQRNQIPMRTNQSSPTYCHFWMCEISSVGFAEEAHGRSVLISFILTI
jgi:hypothetical protein